MEYGVRSCFGKLRRVLMHRPSEELQLVTDPSSWGFKARPNWQEAGEEFDALVDVLKAENVSVELIDVGSDVPPPNLYFTRDLGLCTTNGLLLANFRTEYRQGEELFLQFMSDSLDIPVFGRIMHGYLEGGDIEFVSDRVVAIGLNYRTNQEGFEQACEFLDEVVFPVIHDKETHLNSIFSMVDVDLALVYESALSKEFLTFLSGNNIETVSLGYQQQSRFGADILRLEADKVVMCGDCDKLSFDLEKRGVDVIPVKMDELKKGFGGPGSLALSLLRD
mgnify:CR=1 FL=1